VRKLVLITGGAGFLGSHLADVIVARGDDVIIADNLITGSVSNVEAALAGGNATFLYADVARPAAELRETLGRATRGRRLDMIFHLASPASPQAYEANQWQTLAVNSIGTMSLIEIAREYGARFIFASTSEIYGNPLIHPQPESYFGNVDPIGPRSCYDESKRFGEAAVAAGVRTLGLDARIVRFFNCYGPRMQSADGRLIPSLIDAALEGRPLPIQGLGRQTRSMTYVDDAISLMLAVAERPQDRLEPVNIGSDEESTVEDVARAVAGVAGMPFRVEYLPARPDDPQRRKPDLTRAYRYGWRPTTPLIEGLQRTYEWFALQRAAYA
jgi:nucleoside-diphosphate-sugar epimerase